MTKQEYYDLLAVSILNGTFPSVSDGRCRYYGPDGRHCAVGLLIPPERYSPRMEGMTPLEDMPDGGAICDAIDLPMGVSYMQLREIQIAHDNYAMKTTSEEGFFTAINNMPVFADCRHVEGRPCAKSEETFGDTTPTGALSQPMETLTVAALV